MRGEIVENPSDHRCNAGDGADEDGDHADEDGVLDRRGAVPVGKERHDHVTTSRRVIGGLWPSGQSSRW